VAPAPGRVPTGGASADAACAASAKGTKRAQSSALTGVPLYQSGQGLHREKLRLGSRLGANWLWYRHRNRVLDAVFARVEKIARLDRQDPELAALSESNDAAPRAAEKDAA